MYITILTLFVCLLAASAMGAVCRAAAPLESSWSIVQKVRAPSRARHSPSRYGRFVSQTP